MPTRRRSRVLLGDAVPFVVALRGSHALRVERDADDGEALPAVFLEDRLPPGQVVAAESPAGPAIDDVLFAEELGESHLVSLKVNEGNVRQRLADSEPAACSPFRVVGPESL